MQLNTAMTTTMFDIQVALPYSNDDDDIDVRIWNKRLEGNADAMQDVHPVVITENDVLLGRGGKKNQHTGNEKLRLMATKYSSFYRAALKREKPAIALLLVHLVQSTKPNGRFLKQTGVEGWEIVSEEVAREKVSQCLRDIVAVVSKFGDQGEPRALTSEALLSRMELDEAKAFVRASVAALTGQPTEFDRESSFSGPLLKRSRSVPNSDSDVDRQSFSKRPRRQFASLSELGMESFGTFSSNRNTTFGALPSHQLPLGELRLELPNSNYSLKSPVWESCYNGKRWENVCVNQAFSKADQLKNDDSAFHRLIDRMILEEQ